MSSYIPCSVSVHIDRIATFVLDSYNPSSALDLHHTGEIMALSRKATALLVCDIQDRFKNVIYKFGAMSATSARMIRFAKVVL